MKTIEQRVKDLESERRPVWASALWIVWWTVWGVVLASALNDRLVVIEEKVGIVQPEAK